MYSHWINSPSSSAAVPKETYNYQDYTNHGVSIGSNLPPNSDRIHFSAQFVPVKRLTLDVLASVARHANETQSWNYNEVVEHCKKFAEGDNTGSAATDPYPTSVQERMVFMKQSEKMYAFQFGVDASWEAFRKKWGVLEFKLGYAFEFIYNKGVDNAIYTKEVADAINAAQTDGQKIRLINDARQNWKDKLYDQINNYISLSVKYSY